MKRYLQAIRNYANFDGRAGREEYWMFVLFNLIFSILAIVADHLLGIRFEQSLYGPIYIFYGLFALIPGLSVAVRRLHDTERNGWMVLLGLIPIIGSIWLIVLLATEGDSEENFYGPIPDSDTTDLKDPEKVTRKADGFILAVVTILVINYLFWAIIPKAVPDFYLKDWLKPINALLMLVGGCIPLLLGFAIRNKTKQIVVFVLGVLYLLYVLFNIAKAYWN